MNDQRHPSEDGHWDIEDIRRLLFQRDQLEAALRRIREAEQECDEPCYSWIDALLSGEAKS